MCGGKFVFHPLYEAASENLGNGLFILKVDFKGESHDWL